MFVVGISNEQAFPLEGDQSPACEICWYHFDDEMDNAGEWLL